MKIVIGVVLFNLFSVLFFSLLYYYLAKGSYGTLEKETKDQDPIYYLDVLYFATTIQAGVGLASVVPQTTFIKCLVILQQLLMISSYIFLIVFFKLK